MNHPEVEVSPGLYVRGLQLPLKLANFRVIAFDMDSTLISIETVDEIADTMGRRAEVAAITEAAMQGELTDYKDSLRRRVALLAGTPVEALEHVYAHRLQVTPGADELIASCHEAGLTSLLVSGGFTFFTDRVRRRLHLTESHGNVLEVQDGRLTGRMLDQAWGDIVDGVEKRRRLLELCDRIGCAPSQAIAVGDGANDLDMMAAAGLSIAYRAKPRVRERASVAIDMGGLDRALELFADA